MYSYILYSYWIEIVKSILIINLLNAFFFVPRAALRIHMSSQTNDILTEFGTFIVELRGEVEMKVRASYDSDNNNNNFYFHLE